jgi:ABC-2 type transport system permease protein
MQQYASEQEITTALVRLVNPASIPRIGFLTGNNERSNYKAGDADYRIVTNGITFRHSLVNQGFDVDTVSADGSDLDTTWTALVIADPKIKFTAFELAKIDHYIALGGNMLIMGEPGRQGVLDPLLSSLGVEFMAGRLVRPGTDFAADFVLSGLAAGADSCDHDFKSLRLANAVISMPGAMAVSYTPHYPLFTIRPVLVSSSGDTWLRSAPLPVDSGDISYGSGDRRGVFPVALALTRTVPGGGPGEGRPGGGREQRIMVVGDADFMSNAEMDRHVPRTENFDFFTGVFRWLDNDRFPVDTSRPKTGDVLNMGRDAVLLVRVVFFGLLPLLLALGGTILLVSRKRR